MATSTQITAKVNKQSDPLEAQFKLWKQTRYLVAQNPATSDYSETKPGYFNGKVVIPGPKYNPKVSEGLEFQTLNVNDFQTLMNRYYIRFVDNRTTENADDSVRQALYTIMTNPEADEYEKILKKLILERRDANKLKRVSS